MYTTNSNHEVHLIYFVFVIGTIVFEHNITVKLCTCCNVF